MERIRNPKATLSNRLFSRFTIREANRTQYESVLERQQSRPQAIPNQEATEDRFRIESSSRETVNGLRRVIYLSLAFFFFALGMLGAFLPVLPTTPFLLLTSFFLVRSSPRLNDALMRSRFVGPILRDWQDHGGVRRDIKLKACFVVACAVAVTILFLHNSLPIVIATIVLALIGIAVILRLPTAHD